MNMQFILTVTPFVIISLVMRQESINGQWTSFSEMVDIHSKICLRHRTCFNSTLDYRSTCCGFCSCDYNCMETASCCLKMFGNLTNALLLGRENRYGCVRTQYISPQHTDYNTNLGLQMVVKCDPAYKNKDEIDKCLNPPKDLDSVVPVTDPPNHYRNKHCAYCNFVSKSKYLIFWKLNIQSNHLITFPQSGLLDKLTKTRGNIMFVAPEYFTRNDCDPLPEYEISSCNVSGLWESYSSDIKSACEQYTDPYNYTYKNIFCYICNQDDITLSLLNISIPNCRDPYINTDFQNPQFSVTQDLDFVKNGPDFQVLRCAGDEFPDLYSTICQKVYCFDDYSYVYDGICGFGSYDLKDNRCFSLFLKLKPVPGERILVGDERDKLEVAKYINDNGLIDRNSLDENSGAETIVFFKTDKTGIIEYMVAYIVKLFDSERIKGEFLHDVMAQDTADVSFGELHVKFKVEPTLFNLTFSSGKAIIFLTELMNDSTEIKVDSLFSYTIYKQNHNCQYKNTRRITKIHRCPHIKLQTNTLSFDIQNGFLFIFGRNLLQKNAVKILTQWEYELINGTVSICLEDYFDIYHLIGNRNSFATSKTADTNVGLIYRTVIELIVTYIQFIL